MHVLIVGGNRFMGRFLVFRLLAGGHRVTLLNRGQHPDPFGDRVERLRGDRTTGDLDRLLHGRRFDAVVDFAAYTGEDGRRLAERLEGATGHLVMISTGQVYLVREGMPRPMIHPVGEQAFDGPVMEPPGEPADREEWAYGTGKRDCEGELEAAWRRGGFPATRIRIPMVNGPGDPLRRMESYLWRLVDGGPVILPDGGQHRVRHVDAQEVARLVVELLGRPETFGQAYNLAQEETPTLAELVDRLRVLTGSAAEVIAVPGAELEAAGLPAKELSPFSGKWMSFIDPARVQAELGFRHAPLDGCLRAQVSCFLASPPADRPPGYTARRAAELALTRWRGTAASWIGSPTPGTPPARG